MRVFSNPGMIHRRMCSLAYYRQLTEANEMLDESKGEIEGDIIYNGDILKWKKLINSFKLRVLLTCQQKN